MEKVVLHAPRFIVFKRINDNTIAAQVRYIRIRIVTVIFRDVNNLLGKHNQNKSYYTVKVFSHSFSFVGAVVVVVVLYTLVIT